MRKFLKRLAIGAVVLLLVVQAVPYGRDHSSPPIGVEPRWTHPGALDLARRACYDCHSHETTWPWYSSVAPVSWLVQRDVDQGREHLNFSAWDRSKEKGDDAAEELAEGEMPPSLYLVTHPRARLTDAEKAELIAGLRALEEHGRTGPRAAKDVR